MLVSIASYAKERLAVKNPSVVGEKNCPNSLSWSIVMFCPSDKPHLTNRNTIMAEHYPYNDPAFKSLLFPKETPAFTELDGKPISHAIAPGSTLRYFNLSKEEDTPCIFFIADRVGEVEAVKEMAKGLAGVAIGFLVVDPQTTVSWEQDFDFSAYITNNKELYCRALADFSTTEPRRKIFIMGKGLGAVAAIAIASEMEVDGLILESCPVTTAGYLKNLGWQDDGQPIGEGFYNLEKLGQIKKPTLIFHGSKDPISPAVEAEKLQSHSGARTKQFFIVPGGDEKLLCRVGGEIYYQTIRKFFDTALGTNTWRQRRRKFKNS